MPYLRRTSIASCSIGLADVTTLLAIILAIGAVLAVLLARDRAAVRRSEERFSRALQASNVGIFEWRPLTDEFFMSERARELYAVPEGAVVRTRSDVLRVGGFHPDDRAHISATVDAIAGRPGAEDVCFDFEYRVVHGGGEVRWVRSQGKVFHDKGGALVTGALTDITERKRAEEALRSSERRYALAMEAAADGHMDWDFETGEFYLSPRMLRIVGHPPDATFADRPDWVRRFPFHPDDRRRWDAAIAAHFAGKEAIFKSDFRIVVNGETRWLAFNFIATRDATGKVIRWTGSIADINDAKRDVASLLDAIPGHVAILTPSGDVDAVNRQLIEYCGQSLRTFKQWWSHGTVHADDVPQVRENFARALASRESYASEARIRRFDGAYRWNDIRGLPFCDANGQLIRWYVLLSDIHDRKSAEQELRDSEARFRGLTTTWSDWYWEQDESLAFTFISGATTKPPPPGYPGGQTLGKKRWELPGIEPVSSTWDEHIATLEARLEFRDFEYLRPLADGSPIYLSTSGAPIFDERGQFKGYHGTVRNITERKLAEKELLRHQEMLELAQRAARTAAFEWKLGGEEGENRYSAEFETMCGVAPGTYDGSYARWKDLVHADDRRAVEEAIERAHGSGDISFEYRILHPDGSTHWLQANGRMFFDPAGKPGRVAGFMQDVTQRKQAEEEVRGLEAQLRRAQRLESLGTMAGGIAHDFNNILGIIMGYGEMALHGAKSDARQQRDLKAILSAGERGRALVDRILVFSRSGIGERIPVNVESVVREALHQLAAKLPENVTIKRRLRAGRAAMLGDSTQVHQVIMNLAWNAVQAMPQGGTLRIDLWTEHFNSERPGMVGSIVPGDYIRLAVSDTGTGIAPDVLERMFDPFFTTKEIGIGSGLGLSLIHGIVTNAGGAIEVTTESAKGSTFTISLPQRGEAGMNPSVDDQPLPRGDGQRVLVVDDEESLVRIAAETLEGLGYAVATFTSSASALRAFDARPEDFDAILTDERMPGMNGSALIRDVRRIDPSIPIVLMSGFVGALDAHDLGADDVLRKPLLARDLATSLARVLSAR